MQAYVAHLNPLSEAIANVIMRVISAVHNFLTSDCIPSRSEYLRNCNK